MYKTNFQDSNATRDFLSGRKIRYACLTYNASDAVSPRRLYASSSHLVDAEKGCVCVIHYDESATAIAIAREMLAASGSQSRINTGN